MKQFKFMKIKNFILNLIIFLVTFLDSKSDVDKYKQFEIKNVPSIRRSDLPNEFTDDSFKTVDEFIRKTANLNFECVIYFDYITGEVLKCAIGKLDEVILNFDIDEFKGKHIASIHNQPPYVFSPPSAKNFGILMRNFEDFELIASKNELWIFKSKCVDEKLMLELNIASIELFNSAWEQANTLDLNENLTDDYCDFLYGMFISIYK